MTDTRSFKLPVLLATISLCLAAVPALARGPGDTRVPDEMRIPGFGCAPVAVVIEQHADELGIDDATLAAIQQLATDGREAAVPLHEAVDDAHLGLRRLLDADPIDTAAVRAQLAIISAAELALSMQQMDVTLSILALLTPDQLVQLRVIMARECRDPTDRSPGTGTPRPRR